jgi:hypothetical protein
MRALAAVLALAALAAPATAQQFANSNTAALVTLTAAGAGTTNSADQTNFYGKGVQLGVNISAKSGTISVVVNILGKDTASGQYYTLCSTAALTATGFTLLTLYPGTTAATNADCNAPLPMTWAAQVVSGTGTTPSVTLTVGASVIE